MKKTKQGVLDLNSLGKKPSKSELEENLCKLCDHSFIKTKNGVACRHCGMSDELDPKILDDIDSV